MAADTAAPTPEQVLIGVALLLDADPETVADQLGRIADLDRPSAYTALFGHPVGDGAEEQTAIARDLLDRIAPTYTASLRTLTTEGAAA
jgi:hypothetical protein